jgi:hypothetical protein
MNNLCRNWRSTPLRPEEPVANLVAAAIAILRLRRNRGPARIGMEVISPQRLCARRSIWQPKAPVE